MTARLATVALVVFSSGAALAGPATAATPPIPGTAVVIHEDTLLADRGRDTTVVAPITVSARGGSRALAAPALYSRESMSRPPAHSPAWRPDGRRIALVTERNRITLVAPDGSGRVDIQAPVDDVMDVDWSPDGRRLAFVGSQGDNVDPANPAGRRADVFVIRADGTGFRRVTTHQEVFAVDWSARAGLTYQRYSLGGSCDGATCTGPPGARLDGVWVTDPERPTSRRRVVRGLGTFGGWSPDGRRLLWRAYIPPARDVLQVRDRRGRVVRNLRFGDDTATWTADGRIAYLAPDLLGSWRIVARRIDGAGLTIRPLPSPDLDARRYSALQMQPGRAR